MDNKIKNLITKHLSFLLDKDFILSPNIRDSIFDKNKKIEELLYHKDNVKIEVSFRSFVDCKSVNIVVERIDKNLSFSFDEFLLDNGFKKDDFLGHQNEKDEAYIERYCALFENAVNHDLQNVLEGKKWIEVSKDYSRIR